MTNIAEAIEARVDELDAGRPNPFSEVERQFGQDIPIWENKRYQPSPALAPTERPIPHAVARPASSPMSMPFLRS